MRGIAMANLYPETESISLEAGEIDEGANDASHKDLILLTPTNGSALRCMGKSGLGVGIRGVQGCVLIVKRGVFVNSKAGTSMNLYPNKSIQWAH
jgi:hypothetical protein